LGRPVVPLVKQIDAASVSATSTPDNGSAPTSSWFDVITGAAADDVMADGELPAGLGDLRAGETLLEGKHFGIVVGPGDVVHMRSGGGGGLGDPLQRDRPGSRPTSSSASLTQRGRRQSTVW
jgi:hypothetical protein